MRHMELTALPGIPHIFPGDDLSQWLLWGLEQAGLRLENGDVLAVTSKVISKAEGRIVDLGQVVPSNEALELGQRTSKDPRLVEVVLKESREILRTRPGLIIAEHRLGFVCANAGVDHSNVQGEKERPRDTVLLLPENPDRSAEVIRRELMAASGAEVGVLVVDSHGRAWRMGTVGVAIGVAGFPALLDLRGLPDLHGERLRITQVGLADEIASAASALMGQAAEGLPAVHIRGLPYPLREGSLSELLRPREQDMFR